MNRIPNDITATLHHSGRMVYGTTLPTGESIHFIISVSSYANSTIAVLTDSDGIHLVITDVADTLFAHLKEHYSWTHLSIDRRIFIYAEDIACANVAVWALSSYSAVRPLDDSIYLIQRMVEAPAGATCESLFSEEMDEYRKYLEHSRPAPSYKCTRITAS